MKISVLIHEDAKQIMLTPESDYEKEALKSIAPEDKIEVLTKRGYFDPEERTTGYTVGLNQAGYYRRWESEESLMFIVTPKKKK